MYDDVTELAPDQPLGQEPELTEPLSGEETAALHAASPAAVCAELPPAQSGPTEPRCGPGSARSTRT